MKYISHICLLSLFFAFFVGCKNKKTNTTSAKPPKSPTAAKQTKRSVLLQTKQPTPSNLGQKVPTNLTESEVITSITNRLQKAKKLYARAQKEKRKFYSKELRLLKKHIGFVHGLMKRYEKELQKQSPEFVKQTKTWLAFMAPVFFKKVFMPSLTSSLDTMSAKLLQASVKTVQPTKHPFFQQYFQTIQGIKKSFPYKAASKDALVALRFDAPRDYYYWVKKGLDYYRRKQRTPRNTRRFLRLVVFDQGQQAFLPKTDVSVEFLNQNRKQLSSRRLAYFSDRYPFYGMYLGKLSTKAKFLQVTVSPSPTTRTNAGRVWFQQSATYLFAIKKSKTGLHLKAITGANNKFKFSGANQALRKAIALAKNNVQSNRSYRVGFVLTKPTPLLVWNGKDYVEKKVVRNHQRLLVFVQNKQSGVFAKDVRVSVLLSWYQKGGKYTRQRKLLPFLGNFPGFVIDMAMIPVTTTIQVIVAPPNTAQFQRRREHAYRFSWSDIQVGAKRTKKK